MATSIQELMSPCRLCPRECGARRSEGERGFCGMGPTPSVGSAGAHFGEERVLVGASSASPADLAAPRRFAARRLAGLAEKRRFLGGGSGTIFLAGCNLGCVFCQNAGLSHMREGSEASAAEVAETMLGLERSGCVNVNFVTPTHFAPALAEATRAARSRGLRVPVVWNCGGYESVEALRCLDGLVEIYMPDAKTLDPAFARAAFGAPDYPERMTEALREMHRQVGDLVVDGGVARRGLLVRHLVMPGQTRDALRVMELLAELSPGTFVNVMGQYRPCWKAASVRGLDRRPTEAEVAAVRSRATELGLRLAD